MALLSSRHRSSTLLAAERDIAPAWLRRFGGEDGAIPVTGRDLFHAVLLALTGDGDDRPLADPAHALGVLRAQQGHAVTTVLEDVIALRPYLWGRVAATVASEDPAELMLMHERLVMVIERVLRFVTDAYVAETARMLGAQARRDPLTGLLNRAGFDEAIDHELAAASRYGAPALLLVDLDGFKSVNDTAGHLAGDRILVGVARLLEQTARAGDFVARLGGDEFAVVLPRTELAKAELVGRRLVEAAARDRRLSWSDGRVGLSVGVGGCDDGADAQPATAEQLVAAADTAMYRAKRAGGDRVGVERPKTAISLAAAAAGERG